MNLDAYLRRIGYEGPLDATPATLASLVHRHALSIPFENVSVLVGGAPSLELADIEAKLVSSPRGGYCYEHNALLAAALRALGFAVTGLSARVRFGVLAGVPTPRSHMLLMVDAPAGPMLADTGFGSLTPTAPLKLLWHDEQVTPHERFRLVPAEGDISSNSHIHSLTLGESALQPDADRLLQAWVEGTWTDIYRFDMARQLPVDYVQQNWYTATRPGALFAQHLIAARPSADGRHRLFDRTLTWRPLNGEPQLRMLADSAALAAVLHTVFGIELSASELAIAWEVSGRSV